MNLTVGLTGLLPGVIVAGAVFAFPVSLLLLRIYRRSVVRIMAAQGIAGARPGAIPAISGSASPARAVALRLVEPAGREPLANAFQGTARLAWQAAAIYATGGVAYAIVMTAGWMLATNDSAAGPVKLLVLFWNYLWPLVIAVLLVAATDRRTAMGVCAVYASVWAILSAISIARSPALTLGQLPLLWILTNGLASVLVLAFFARPVRAVGLMVVTFFVVGVAGSQLVVSIAATHPAVLQVVAATAFQLGLGARVVLLGLNLLGFAAFAALAWPLLRVLGGRYARKRLSDQSMMVSAIWLLFGVVQSIELAFEAPGWIATGLVAFVAFKATTVAGFRLVAPPSRPRTLLLLRVFALGKRSEELFTALRKLWLRQGSISLIAGPDLVTSTIEPHQFLDFVAGGLRRRFVAGAEDLARQIAGIDLRPDPDGLWRVNEFFCHADTWQPTMRQLAARSDAVLMDLRSFSATNQGCLYELGQLLEAVPLGRIVFVIDDTTDASFLEASLRRLSAGIGTDSPNSGTATLAPLLFRAGARTGAEVNALLHLLPGQDLPAAGVAAGAG